MIASLISCVSQSGVMIIAKAISGRASMHHELPKAENEGFGCLRLDSLSMTGYSRIYQRKNQIESLVVENKVDYLLSKWASNSFLGINGIVMLFSIDISVASQFLSIA